MYPKHILIARAEGPEAGLNAYMNGRGINRLQDGFKTISKKRTEKSRLDAYCTIFADKLGAPLTRAEKRAAAANDVLNGKRIGDVQAVAEAAIEDEDAIIAAAVKAALASLGVVPAEPVVEAKPVIEGVIPCGEAWRRLGADEAMKPSRDHSEPASQGQLWHLNARGELRLV